MTKEARSEKDELAQAGGATGQPNARMETMEQLQLLEEKMLSNNNDRGSAASGIAPQRQSGEPRQQLMQLEQEVLHEKTSSVPFSSQHSSSHSQTEQARLVVEHLEASPSVPPLVAQEARAALQLLEAKSVASQGEALPLTPAERAMQQLEAKAVSHGPTTNTNGGTARDQMRNALSQLESKATGHDSTSATGKTRAALHELEPKFTTTTALKPPTKDPGAALRSSLNQLESKFTATNESNPQPPPEAGAALRSSLNQLESKFTSRETPSSAAQPGAAFRSSLNQLESKFASNETAMDQARQSLHGLEREVRVGAVAINPRAASVQARESLHRMEAKLEKDLDATNCKGGTAVAASSGHISQQARESLHRMEAKLEKELGNMPMGGTAVAVSSAQGSVASSSSVSPAAASSLHRLQEKLEHDNLLAPAASSPGVSAADRMERVEQKMLEQNMIPDPPATDSTHAALERRLNTLEEKAVRADPAVLSQTSISAEETLEHKLLDKYGQEGKDQELLALEDTLEETAFAASRRGDGNAGAFANEPADALPGHGPRNPRPQQATNQHLPTSQGGTTPTSLPPTSGHFQIEAGLYELDTEEGLAKAILVNEHKEHLPVGVPEDDSVDMEKKKRMEEKRSLRDRKFGIIGCVIVVIVVIVVVAVVRTTDNDSSVSQTLQGNSTNLPTAPPSLAPTPYIISLPDYTWLALQDPESPQSQAYKWLQGDPFLESYSESKMLQRLVLAILFYATKGDEWTLNTDWLSYDVDECFWFSKFNTTSGDHAFNPHPVYYFTTPDQLTGVPVCNDEGGYLALVLSQNGLAGSLPKEITMLSNLKLLALSSNEELTGSMTSEFGLMSNMQELDLGNTKITGTIPSELGLMTGLEHFIVREVGISGTLPSELGMVTTLKEIEIMHTNIMGTIPLEYYNLRNITFFGLYRNQLTGTLPTEIGLLADTVETFRVNENYLSGTLPSEIGLLTKMTILFVYDNELIGTIPTEIGNLGALKDLFVDINAITGTIPAEVENLSSLSTGSFADLLLTGTVPLSLWTLPSLMAGLDISGNPFLEGSIPTEIGIASKHFALFVNDMGEDWGGPIPSELGLQTNLFVGWFQGGKLEGTVPTEMAQMSGLQQLRLHNNPLLTGTFPVDIGSLPLLEYLSLNGTQLRGELSEETCLIPTLYKNCPLMCGCGCVCDWQS